MARVMRGSGLAGMLNPATYIKFALVHVHDVLAGACFDIKVGIFGESRRHDR